MRKKILVFLTNNLSLQTWHNSKILDREIFPFVSRTKYDFIFISYGSGDEEKFIEEYPNLSVYKLRRPNLKKLFFLRIYQPFFSLLFDKKLNSLVNNSNLILSNQMDGALLPAILALFNKKKFILRTGYSFSFFSYKNRKSNIFVNYALYFYEFLCILISSKYTVSSIYEYDFIKKRYSFFSKKTFIVPNWIDIKKFKPTKNKEFNKISLISIGRLEPQKNPFDLVLISKISNIPLTIIGDGVLKPILLDFIKDINAPVKILSKIANNDLPKIINNHSLYISTSLYEGSPKTVLEAMSCGLITVAYEAVGINEIIVNKKNGFITAPSPYIMSKLIKDIILDQYKLLEISNKARSFILKFHSYEKIIKKQNKIYFN